MAENKNVANEGDVQTFLAGVEPEKRREDAYLLFDLMSEITGMTPTMWGENMVGFGQYHYKYASGREGDYFLTGFPRAKPQ